MPLNNSDDFTEEVTRLLESGYGATRSDAQALVETNESALRRLWVNNYTAELATSTVFGPAPTSAEPSRIHLATEIAACTAGHLVDAIRAAHKASCDDGGPMELLLRETIAQAVALSDRLATLAQFANDNTRGK